MYSKNVANFESFRQVISSGINLLFLMSVQLWAILPPESLQVLCILINIFFYPKAKLFTIAKIVHSVSGPHYWSCLDELTQPFSKLLLGAHIDVCKSTITTCGLCSYSQKNVKYLKNSKKLHKCRTKSFIYSSWYSEPEDTLKMFIEICKHQRNICSKLFPNFYRNKILNKCYLSYSQGVLKTSEA